MPLQETFFEEQVGRNMVSVLKTYDVPFAHESLNSMDVEALARLASVLNMHEELEAEGISDAGSPGYADLLWDELLEVAREEGNRSSFFVVWESHDGRSGSVYVAPDWPSAEIVARERISTLQSTQNATA